MLLFWSQAQVHVSTCRCSFRWWRCDKQRASAATVAWRPAAELPIGKRLCTWWGHVRCLKIHWFHWQFKHKFRGSRIAGACEVSSATTASHTSRRLARLARAVGAVGWDFCKKDLPHMQLQTLCADIYGMKIKYKSISGYIPGVCLCHNWT